MQISIIIPNYNGAGILRKNIPHVLEVLEQYREKHKSDVEVIILDDGSTDESREVLSDMFGNYTKAVKVRLLFNNKNYGFSTTVNKGVEAAVGEIVVLLNTDVVPESGFLEPLLSHFHDEKVFSVGCLDKSMEDGKIVMRGRGIGKWERGFLIHNAGDLNKMNTLWVSGGSGAFRKSIWEKLGGMTELMNPFYWEDVDLGYRALKSGYDVLFEKQSMVMHSHDEGSIKKTQSANKIQKTAYRNQIMFVWLNITSRKYLCLHLIWLPYHIVNAIAHKDFTFLKGLFSAFILLPRVYQLRLRYRKLFKLNDGEILQKFNE